jgi:hypothetical protein
MTQVLESMLVGSKMKVNRGFKHSFVSRISVCYSIIVSIFVSIFTLVWFLRFYDTGIEFSDEGKYLVDINFPFEYEYSVTNYGLFYHFIGKIIGFDIPNLRFFNVFFTLTLASIATYVSIRSHKNTTSRSKYDSVIIAFISGCCSLSFFGIVWVLTPNYNSLTFQALLLIWIGVVKVSNNDPGSKQNAYLVYIGFTLGILFIAKPTSMLILYPILLAYLIVTNLRTWVWVSLMPLASIFTIMLFSLFKFQNPLGIFTDLYDGILFSFELSNEYSLLKILTIPFAISIFSILIYIFRFRVKAAVNSDINWIPIYVCISFVGIIFSMAIVITTGVNIFLALLVALLTLHTLKTRWEKSIPRYFLFLLIFPFIAAFGSNNNMLVQSLMYSYFILLFILAVVTHEERDLFANNLLSWILLSSILLTFQSVFWSSTHPYRQNQSITKMDSNLNLDAPLTGLLVSKEVGNFFQETSSLSRAVGFSRGTPVLDLTGQSSTLLFSLNAKILADSWLIGGYPGSNSVALSKINDLQCTEIRSAWLLLEPDGPRAISFNETLGVLGLSLNQYFQVATWKTPTGSGGFKVGRTQYLLKPMNVDTPCTKFQK